MKPPRFNTLDTCYTAAPDGRSGRGDPRAAGEREDDPVAVVIDGSTLLLTRDDAAWLQAELWGVLILKPAQRPGVLKL